MIHDKPEIELELKTIGELLKHKFFVPHYQRGYRWGRQQVEQLLDDIDAFRLRKDGNQDSFYCLQPLVLKRMKAGAGSGRNPDEEWFEVIDGQQRLTTIYLILRYINEFWGGRQKKTLFDIDYETRDKCVEFLRQITVSDDDRTVEINKDNIDFYHISMAYQAIRDWEHNYSSRHDGKDLDSAGFQSAFLARTKVIWYEIGGREEQEESEKLFERLNLGKIPLTNAELTKALFLASDSFSELGPEEQRVRHFEIALMWDEMEHALNAPDKRFWSFITNEDSDAYATKIELLLDLVAEKPDGAKDQLYTFLHFQQKSGRQKLSSIWSEIEQFYSTLLEWHNNRDLYHWIGYLITVDTVKKSELNSLVRHSMEHPKDEFHKLVRGRVADSVNCNISELEYGSVGDQKMIFHVLLLFNVETCRTTKSISEFYPYKEHKSNYWSLEHIHARNSDGLDRTKREQWSEWLELHVPVLQELRHDSSLADRHGAIDELLSDIAKYDNDTLTWERFSPIFDKVNELLTDSADRTGTENDGLSNLALLSQPDNAALNSSAFAVKRREIVRLDKEGSFIPVCTRRAFMKYYVETAEPVQNFFWSPDDRGAYLDEIRERLGKYLPQTATEVSDATE